MSDKLADEYRHRADQHERAAEFARGAGFPESAVELREVAQDLRQLADERDTRLRRNPLRTITTEAELTELLADEDRSVTLKDSGGFTWWTEYTSAAGNILVGCASVSDGGQTIGQTVRGWMNAMRPAQAIAYGPFTIIYDSKEEGTQ